MKNTTNKLYDRLLKAAPNQASSLCTWLFGEAKIPDSMKKETMIGKQHKEKN